MSGLTRNLSLMPLVSVSFCSFQKPQHENWLHDIILRILRSNSIINLWETVGSFLSGFTSCKQKDDDAYIFRTVNESSWFFTSTKMILLILSLYHTFVGSSSIDGIYVTATRVFKEMIDRRYVINLTSFSTLVSELCAKGKVFEAEELFKEMSKSCPNNWCGYF